MKSKIASHKNLNGGKDTQIFYPLADQEFFNQFAEIFDQEHYAEGKVKDGVYVDLGANIGLTALYFAPCAKEYYAIEPSTACYEALLKNTVGLPIKIFNFAITPSNEEDYFFQTAQDSVPQTFFAKDSGIYGREKVQCKRIDTFFKENNIEHVDVLKIDVESSEYVILPDDSFKNVADKIDLIIGEAHYDATTGAIPQIIPVILRDYGFETRFLDMKNMEYLFSFVSKDTEQKTYKVPTNTLFVARRKT